MEVPKNELVRTGMRVFERTFTPSNPTTVRGRIYTDGEAAIIFSLQRRRTDDGLSEALDSGPTSAVGGLLVPRAGWHDFSFDFDQPRITTRSVRLLVDIRDNSGRRDGTTVLFDDLAWVEWQTPWLDGEADVADTAFATHVQFKAAP